jgi:hypothetical protein
MRVSWNNIGVILAIVAGLASIGYAMWPITPQAHVEAGQTWLLVSFVAGVAFLVAAFGADRMPAASRLVLAIGAVALVGSALFFGRLGGTRGLIAAVIDLGPAILALISAATIGPIQRSASEIATSPGGAPMDEEA